MPYVFQPYPRMIYKGESQLIVQNFHEETAALLDGWGRTPGSVAPVVDVVAAPLDGASVPEPARETPPMPAPIPVRSALGSTFAAPRKRGRPRTS